MTDFLLGKRKWEMNDVGAPLSQWAETKSGPHLRWDTERSEVHIVAIAR